MVRLFPLSIIVFSTAVAADLPVREVILYKHGVAFFERFGDLKSGDAARLDFKASEMNDVLKSLTLTDRSGGKIDGVRYDSSEPVDRRLADFPFHLAAQQPISAFLDSMKGARIELKFAAETVTGSILGSRLAAGDKEHLEREQVTLLLDAGEIRTFDLAGAAAIRFADPGVQRQLTAYLSVIGQARSTDRRSVYIDSPTGGARQIVARYMIPAPVWKSSYRLIFGDRAGESTLEGWAIVDNTTADDWTNVRLALVSGRPVSFISSLYEPKYIQRRTADLDEYEAVGPTVYEGAVGTGAAPPPPPQAAPGAPPRAMLKSAAPRAMDRAEVAPSTVSVTTEGRELGDLFEYRFSTPVTVKRGESAMLPFLQQSITSRKLLIYSDGSMSNPMNAAEITNSTGKTLDGGPLTIYDGGVYGGEALVETIKAGDKRLISYAVDLGTRITTAFDSTRNVVREMHYSRGILTSRTAQQETKTYTIRNVDQKAKTLIIEHPVRPQYTLLTAKPAETTTRAYRFEVKLAAGATEKFPVAEERVYDSTVAVVNLTPDVLATYIQNKALSERGKQQLEKIAAAKRALATADAEIRRLDGQSNELVKDEERLRQNIASLGRVAGQEQQVQQYSRQLAAAETKITALRDQISEARRKHVALEQDLNTAIETAEF